MKPLASTDLSSVAAQLHFPPDGASLCTDWDAAMQTDPADGLPFLQTAYITHAARDVFLTDDMIRELVAFAPRIAGDEEVVAFFWYCRHRMLHDHTLLLSWEEQWPLLVGEGAITFAREHGVPLCPPDALITDRQRRRLAEHVTARHGAGAQASPGTVGAVAIDVQGRIVAGTSTGGYTGKRVACYA